MKNQGNSKLFALPAALWIQPWALSTPTDDLENTSHIQIFFFLPMLFRISSVINRGTQFPRTLISLPKKRTTKFAKGDSSPLEPWNSHFIFLIPNTVKAKERESIWELKNKRAKISNNEKKKSRKAKYKKKCFHLTCWQKIVILFFIHIFSHEAFLNFTEVNQE